MTDLSKLKNQSLSFNDFVLETVTVELRHPFAYLLWDRAGQLCQEIDRKLPGYPLNIPSASPASIIMTYGEKFEIGVEQARFYVGIIDPKVSLSQFFEVLKVVFDVVVELLDIEIFHRIGFRQIFNKDYSSMKKASEALSALPSIKIPESILAENQDKNISPGFMLRVDDGKKACFIICAAKTKV